MIIWLQQNKGLRFYKSITASSSGLVEKSIGNDPDFIQVYDYSTEPQGLKYEPGMYNSKSYFV